MDLLDGTEILKIIITIIIFILLLGLDLDVGIIVGGGSGNITLLRAWRINNALLITGGLVILFLLGDIVIKVKDLGVIRRLGWLSNKSSVGPGAGDTVNIKQTVKIAYHFGLDVDVAGDLSITNTLDCLTDEADGPDSLSHDGVPGDLDPLKGELHLVNKIQIYQVVVLMGKLRGTRDSEWNSLAHKCELSSILNL